MGKSRVRLPLGPPIATFAVLGKDCLGTTPVGIRALRLAQSHKIPRRQKRKGNHWLELTRNWILEANQAKNLASQDNFSEMKNYLKKIGSNRRLAAGRLEIDFKKPFNLLANLPAEARGEAPSEATNSIWWCLLDEIRTHFEQNPD